MMAAPKKDKPLLSESSPLMVRMHDEDRAKLQVIAEEAGMALATYARKVLRDHIQEKTKKR